MSPFSQSRNFTVDQNQYFILAYHVSDDPLTYRFEVYLKPLAGRRILVQRFRHTDYDTELTNAYGENIAAYLEYWFDNIESRIRKFRTAIIK